MTVRPLAAISVLGSSTDEGDVGTHPLTFQVVLTHASSRTITVHYATVNGSAKAPGDYSARSGVLTFSAGQTTELVGVPVVGDRVKEPNEAFQLRLSNPSNATLRTPTATGGIRNDD
jgi:chitinase